MDFKGEISRLKSRMENICGPINMRAIAAIAAYPPGTTPDPLPPDAPQAAIDFRAMLVEMDHRTCPLPPEKIEV